MPAFLSIAMKKDGEGCNEGEKEEKKRREEGNGGQALGILNITSNEWVRYVRCYDIYDIQMYCRHRINEIESKCNVSNHRRELLCLTTEIDHSQKTNT